MVAHFHGQVWNAADFARSLRVGEPTARRYLDILTSAFMARQLPPWFENLGKRQVKTPKIYGRDTGLLHSLLGLDTFAALQGHPKLGASARLACTAYSQITSMRKTGSRPLLLHSRIAPYLESLLSTRAQAPSPQAKHPEQEPANETQLAEIS